MASDGELVSRYVGGDRSALGDIYERYSNQVYDLCMAMLHSPEDAADAFQDTFLIAARRLDGLRKPERLRPWLYSVARNQCRASLRERKRTHSEADAGSDVGVEVNMTGRLETSELSQLVADAEAGLSERDQEILSLYMRHGLEGEDLAEVLGVSVQSAYKLVQRVKTRVERSIGSLLVARHGRRDCPSLDKLLAGWDGKFDSLLRKRVSRHIDGCDVCTRRRKALLDPSGMASALPFTPVPDALRTSFLDSLLSGTAASPTREPSWRGDGFPAPVGKVGRRMSTLTFAVVVGVLVVIGGAIGAVGAGMIRSRDAASPPVATLTAAPTTVSTTTEPATSATSATIAPTTSTTTTTSIVPTTTTTVVVTTVAPPVSVPAATTSTSTSIAPTTAPPTTAVPTTTPPATATTAAPSTTTTSPPPDTTPPVFGKITDPGALPITEVYPTAQCTAYPTSASLTAEVSDNVAVSRTWASWDIYGVGYTTDFAHTGNGLWAGEFGPFASGTAANGANGADVAITIHAADTAGNSTIIVLSRTIRLVPCP